jgi:hypothetical protein
MKYMSIIIAVLFQTVTMFGQKPYQGSYMARRNFSAFYLTLKNDSLFDAKRTGCMSWNKGAGKFTSNKKQLLLQFTDSITPYVISKTTCVYTDSMHLNITVKDRETHLPLQARIGFVKTGIGLYTTDENGHVFIRRKKMSADFTLYIETGMYNLVSVPFKPGECADITVYLEQRYQIHLGKGTVWSYNIIRHNRRRLILRDEFGKWKLKKVQDQVDRT